MKHLILLLFLISSSGKAQLKYIIEDFEGFPSGNSGLKENGVFSFGYTLPTVNFHPNSTIRGEYSGDRCLHLSKTQKPEYGGWGKGLGIFIELNAEKDFLNFYVQHNTLNDTNTIRIELQEDDNADHRFDKNQDDSWIHHLTLSRKNYWELVSIPLNQFYDANKGGDGIFNVGYKGGKLTTFIITFSSKKDLDFENWNFDFICFSEGKLETGDKLFKAPLFSSEDHCSLGAWSQEGNVANFCEIALNFEKVFKPVQKKLGVVHFFQPFSTDGGNTEYMYPSVERINKVIDKGYVPMITLENHFVNTNSKHKQPNLYSIIEGHFDLFFANWAKEMKQVKDVVLLRILHEFNGDWYPWCILKNDKNPELLVKAYRRIHGIFKAQGVSNVRFIWCPNSMSIPQEPWNFILKAYPGNDYVDFVGLDVYNGAGKSAVWRSFRKEVIENYFLLTKYFPSKPLLVCETASREPLAGEQVQSKAEWIKQMTEALKTDLSKVRLVTWFNEKETFKITSSDGSQNAFLNYVFKDDYFRSGTGEILQLIK
jgi:beta-mannanase